MLFGSKIYFRAVPKRGGILAGSQQTGRRAL